MKCHQDNRSSFDDYVPPVENPAQEEERNDGELNTEVEPPQQENELAEFELEYDPETAVTDTEDTHDEQVTQNELEEQPQAALNARGRVIRPPARYKDFEKGGCSIMSLGRDHVCCGVM